MKKIIKNWHIRISKTSNRLFEYGTLLRRRNSKDKKSRKFSQFMALLIISFTGANLPAHAAMWPTDSSSLNITAYPLDAENRSIPAYSDAEMTCKIGTVYGTDQCTILSAVGNALLVEYPVKNGKKTGFVSISAFSNADLNNGTSQGAQAKDNITVYTYKTGNQKLGTIFPSDFINIVYSDNATGRSQVIYPIEQGYKMGWIDWMPENSDNENYANPASIAQGVYKIRSAMDTNMVIDIFAGSIDYGNNIQLYRDKDGENQKFWIIPVGDGWYKICSIIDDRMCIDIYGGTNQAGSNICLWEYHNQLWRFIPCDDGSYLIESHLGLYLDVENAENRDEANIIAYYKNADSNQRWFLEPAVINSSVETSQDSEQAKIQQKLDDLGNGAYDDGSNTFSINRVYKGQYSNEQCKGYAKRLHQIFFGYNIGGTGNKQSGNNYKINIDSSRTAVIGSLSKPNMSEQELQLLFSKARPGDFVQLRREHTGSHSMIFYSADSEGAIFYESNLDNKNTIKKNWYSWGQLYSQNMGISVYTAIDYWLH